MKRFFLLLGDALINVTIVCCILFAGFLGFEAYFKKNLYIESSSSAVNLPIFQESKYRSWDMKPNTRVLHGYGEPKPEVNINSNGLRDNEIPKEKQKKRVLLLGDSFVFGMGGRQSQTIARFLNVKYFGEKYVRVINGGVIGQSIDDAYLYLKNEGKNFFPDVVVYNFFVGNDITELRRHTHIWDEQGDLIRVYDNEHYINKENFLRKKGGEIPDSFFIFWLKNRLHPVENSGSPTLTWPVFFADDSPKGDPNLHKYWGTFVTILDRMNAYCKENNIHFIVNIIPMDVQVSKKYWNKYPTMPFGEEEYLFPRPQKRISFLLDQRGIEYIDSLEKFRSLEQQYDERGITPGLYFSNDPHYSWRGNMRTANAIYNKIQEKGYLK